MSVSIEALAMSGANYLEYGMDIEERERLDLEPPPHLLAEEEEEEEEENKYGFPITHSVKEFQSQLTDLSVMGDSYTSSDHGEDGRNTDKKKLRTMGNKCHKKAVDDPKNRCKKVAQDFNTTTDMYLICQVDI